MCLILMIRHGATQGNLEKRYVGSTDEPLIPESRDGLRRIRAEIRIHFPEHDFRVYASPMLRCLETARILFPDRKAENVRDFEECRFGNFEYRNWKELAGEPLYRQFIDSGGRSAFPGGEDRIHFSERVIRAFERLDIREDSALVVHGGTIMALLDRYSYPHRDYFEWQTVCGSGFAARWNGEMMTDIAGFSL